MEKDCCKEEKGFEEKNNMLEYVLLSMVAVILVLALFQSVQINSLKNTMMQGVSAAASMASGGAAGKLNTAGCTEDEKMMYEHHGTVPARLQGKGQSTAPSTGMVGGC